MSSGSESSRKLKYALAINEALRQLMETDPNVFLIGQGVKSPWYVGQTCTGLLDQFSERRVIDTPVSENAVNGAGVGAAIAGMRPVVVHPRVDFMMYGLDPIINEAANWHYMFGGAASVPVVIWGITNRGGEQGAQHSQALQALFAHIPGLKVVMPSNARDAKGLMIAAIRDDNPVIYLDDRWLYGEEFEVPEEIYETPIGKADLAREGKDLSIITSSYLTSESLKLADQMAAEKKLDIEVLDLRTIKPLDEEAIVNTAKKTGKVVVVDGGWRSFGIAAEISAIIADKAFSDLKAPIKRVTLPDIPAPASQSLEAVYYFGQEEIASAIQAII